jgi:hypothetical protein
MAWGHVLSMYEITTQMSASLSLSFEPRHVAFIAPHESAGAELRHVEQLLVRVVPRVPCGVVLRRGHSVNRESGPPIRLAHAWRQGDKDQACFARPPSSDGKAV